MFVADAAMLRAAPDLKAGQAHPVLSHKHACNDDLTWGEDIPKLYLYKVCLRCALHHHWAKF